MKRIDFKKIIIILAGALLLLILASGFIFKKYLDSYRVIAGMELVATVKCVQDAESDRPMLNVEYHHAGSLDGQEQRYLFTADEWVIEARIVKMSTLFSILGVKRYYRLERISGRYFDVEKEKTMPRIVYSIYNDSDRLWWFLYRHQDMIPGIAAAYGNSAFLPFEIGKIFKVYVTNSGLMIQDISVPTKREWWQTG
ncbi:MAG: hypothetical protein GY853_11105 [PVC group bacterium]|nr:hypothetical protein [PVC group bacterium]